ncbi:MAG: AAA family ATPase [Syntrophomonadaceae bacterium]|jgi:uncharacterized protein YhaN|nr:AAA family ATPase [Syntrophomonadaceae bacterium]MDH7497641.1 AAA family ATPase [Syntrophomonadaceae bacterium]
MKINKLDILGFGKFENFQLELADGLNIVWGPNESGKSTLAAFLRAAFFGFGGANPGGPGYEAQYQRYLPWAARNFSGAVEYEVDGKHYRAERVFDRNSEEVKVFSLDTGQEITRSFPYDKARREHDFASEQLGMHEKVFSNSIFLGQGAFAIDAADAGSFIKDKLVNLMMTGDEEVSLKRALWVLDQAIDDIGTPQARKKALGAALARLESLQGELAALESQLAELNERERELEDKRRQLVEVSERSELLQRAHLYMEAAEHFERYVAAKALLERLTPEQLMRELREAREGLEQSRARTDQLRKDAEELERHIKVDNPDFWIKKIDDLTETILRLNRESASLAPRVVEQEQQTKQSQSRSGMLLGGAGALLVGSLVALAVGAPLAVAGGTFAVAAGMGYLGWRSFLTYQESARSGEEVDVRANMNRLLIMENQNMLNDILGQLGASDVDQAKKLLQESMTLRNRKKELQHEIESSQKQVWIHEHQVQMLEKRMVEVQNATIERDKEIAVLNSLGFKDVEKNTQEFIAISEQLAGQGGPDDRQLEQELAALAGRRDELLLEIGKLEQQVKEKNAVQGRIADVRADMEAGRARCAELSEMLEVLKLARAGVEEAVSGYQKDYLGKLNHRVSRIAAELFGGRYSTVNLTEDLGLTAIAPETMKMVPVDSTSQGTLEMFYLALRLALADLMSGGRSPVFLVLDEPFANLDDQRARRLLDFLGKVAGSQQVILFTAREDLLPAAPPQAHIVRLEMAA